MAFILDYFQRAPLKKRPRDADDDPPSNASPIAAASLANPSKKRKIAKPSQPPPKLSEANASQAHNIQRQYLLHVEIPVFKSSQVNAQLGFNRRADSAIDDDDEIRYEDDEEFDPVTSSSPRVAAPTPQYLSRSGRPINLKQAFSDDSDMSDASPPKRTTARTNKNSRATSKKKLQKDADSDFEDNIDVEDESDDISSLSIGASSSVDVPSDDSEFEQLAKNKKGGSKTAAKPSTSQSADESTPAPQIKKKPSASMMDRLLRPGAGTLDENLPPLHDIGQIFEDITAKALTYGFDKFLETLNRPLRVATMCSGTESPLLALEMVNDALRKSGSTKSLEVEHIFSAEIVPYKQAYIERNFAPPIIFRDIAEFVAAVNEDEPTATTAYGARVPIPTNPDIVVAGTSCVDFSRLNNKQKGLGDGGESDRTWHGAYAYCETYQPPIIVFENVLNADWNEMLKAYRQLGYDCRGVQVDTKDYYIPHTRQRGYLVCIKAPPGETDRADKWVKMMKKFKRPASSPVSSFMIPNDQVTVRPLARSDDTVREVDWSTCEITQMEYRQDKALGNARPFTHWQESGTMSVPERGLGDWYRAQVERVLDTIDCCILRKALPPPLVPARGQAAKAKDYMYDVRYKTRIWDLSQNVYRNEDTQPFGVTGCITPSGQFFISDAGRAMTPEETLILQGLPLHKISFTTESPRELQDLAGNAMTASVIGPAILAALTAGTGLLEDATDAPTTRELNLLAEEPSRLAADRLVEVKSDVPIDSVDLPAILAAAQQALRLCYCEGPQGRCEKDLQVCVDCGHTACLDCAENPDHNYVPLPKASRISPLDFEASLRSQLPLIVKLSESPPLDHLRGQSSDVEVSTIDAYVAAVQKATSENFKFSHVRRTYCWTAAYVNFSGTGRLDLVIEKDRCEWRLFAVAPAYLAVKDPLRTHLVQPIGKCVVRDNLLSESWLWRPIMHQSISLKITPKGARIASWWARSEMPDFKEHKQFEKLRIETKGGTVNGLDATVDGLYQYLPKCGTACEGLYKRIEPDTPNQPLFLFLDPSRTGSSAKDRFVFSHTSEVLEYNEVRPVMAAIQAPWRPWPVERPFNLSDRSALKSASQEATLEVESVWIPTDSSIALRSETIHHDILAVPSFALAPNMSACAKPALLVQCNVESDVLHGTCDGTNKALDAQFVLDNAWIFEAMRRQLPESSEWMDLPLATEPCSPCAPSRPAMRWKLDDSDKVVPYEDPSSAAIYERSVKSRPAPLIVQATRADNGVSVDLGVNLVTLAHRAMARLPHDVDRSNIALSWRLDTSHASQGFIVKPFTLQPTVGVEPSSGVIGLKVNLFPQQRLVLAWMKQQEKGAAFVLEESEEAILPQLGWRVEVRARAKITVRGGICADHAGFGKTITSLALVQSDFEGTNETPADTKALRKTLEQRRDAKSPGLSVSVATLIICPELLVSQWCEEAEEKLGYKIKLKGQSGDIVVIKKAADLGDFLCRDFEQAKIIIVDRTVFGNDSYTSRLASFAGVAGPAEGKRSYHHWHRFATSQIPEHVQLLQRTKGLTELKVLLTSKYRQHLASDDFKAAVPSKRLRGKVLVAATAARANVAERANNNSVSKNQAKANVDTKHVGSPLFEMFRYNRIIVDEFHEGKEKELVAISALSSDKIWGLSATPAKDDCYEVSRMAKLLHVPLRMGSNAKGIMKSSNARILKENMTSFELFDTMRQLPSTGTQDRIQQHGQLFLDTFVRQNIADHADMPIQQILLPVQLDLDHRVMYSELSQHLNSADMRIRKGKKSEATERDTRLTRATADSSNAEEALSKTASFFDRGQNTGNGVQHLVTQNEVELKSLLEAIAKPMAAAAKGDQESFDRWVENRLSNATLGDKAAIDLLEAKMAELGIKTGGPLSKKKSSKPKEPKDGEAPLTTTSKLSNRLVVSQRSLRFYENVAKLQAAYRDNSKLMDTCDNANCAGGITSVEELAVSAHCGHIICIGCHDAQQTKQCVSEGCSSHMDSTQLLWAGKMGDLAQTISSPFGRKFQVVVELLTSIKQQRQQAILFVQHAVELEQAERVFATTEVNAIIVDDLNGGSDQIATFKAKPGKYTVLVLNSSDETAAGLNLQFANHVIFFAPLLRDTQYKYDSTMAQAIGRVKRYGQKRKIFVYRVLALNTIDVDILEQRERRTDALTEFGHEPVEAPMELMDVDDAKKVRTQLVREGGVFSLRPRAWLTVGGGDGSGQKVEAVKKKDRVHGWEDFSSLVKWSRAYTDDDD